MQYRSLFLLIIILMLNSCVTYNASTSKAKEIRHSQLVVEPTWKKSKVKGKWIIPTLGIIGGGTYGYISENRFENDTTKLTNIGAGAGTGLFLGVLLNASITIKSKRAKRFDVGEKTKWLKSYNDLNNTNYVFSNYEKGISKNELVLIHPNNLQSIQESYDNCLHRIPKLQTPLYELESCEKKVKNEFQVLGKHAVVNLSSTILNNKDLIVSQDIEKELSKIMQTDYSLDKITKFKNLKNRYDLSQIEYTMRSNLLNKITIEQNNTVCNGVRKKESIVKNTINITDLNLEIRRFLTDFNYYKNNSCVENTYNNICSYKTEVIQTNVKKIAKKMEDATSIKELDNIRGVYLTHTLDHPEVIKIKGLYKLYFELLELENELKEIEKVLDIQKESTFTGEPTQDQMKYAVNTNLQYRTKAFPNVTSKIIYFNKYGCIESSNKPGFICDYVTEIDVDGGIIGATQDAFKQFIPRTLQTGRFSKVNGYWKLLEDIK